jgi:hypothetical protein
MSRRIETLPCTIDIEHTAASLHAHVNLDGARDIQPGDRVRVLGAPIVVRFGERLTLRRNAEVRRAGFLERQWTRLTAGLSLTELYEVSFTPGRLS